MNLYSRLTREFRGYNYLEGARRVFDEKPMQCGLYVTDRCNLNCAYCTEYDNSRPHPKTEDLKAWLRKIRDLGTTRIALAGGEPLLHPDIVELVRYCRELGFSTSLTTNAFLLNKDLMKGLENAGLQVIQISVDRMTPSSTTRKSLQSITSKLDLFKNSPIHLHLTGVLCGDTIAESRQVLQAGLERGIPTEVRLVHAGPDSVFRVDRGDTEGLLKLLNWMKKEKARGTRIHTNEAILHYQTSWLEGKDIDWTCTAGYKIFFVSSEGMFWPCSMQRTDISIMDITHSDLRSHYRKKECQSGCGVYCAVSTSLIYAHPLKVVGREFLARVKRMYKRGRCLIV